MWWFEHRSTVSRIAGLATTLALASLLTGCFEPLYGERTLAAGAPLKQRFSTIGILPINTRRARVDLPAPFGPAKTHKSSRLMRAKGRAPGIRGPRPPAPARGVHRGTS